MPRIKTEKRVRFGESSRPDSATKADDVDSSTYVRQHRAAEHESDSDDGLLADISGRRHRRREVQVDGYGSDASDQDEVGNLSDYSDDQDEQDVRDGDNDGSRDQMEEDDMFAEGNGGTGEALGTDKRRKRYLEISEIEGQEMSSESRVESAGGLDSRKGKEAEHGQQQGYEEPGESEGATNGVKIEAFNMRDDLEEGSFDTQGNFVWNKKDPQAYQDSWLNNVSRSTMQLARESKERQGQQQQDAQTQSTKRWDSISNDDIIISIINMLLPHETVFAALARIGGRKKKTKWSNKRAKNKKNQHDEMEVDKDDAERKEKIEKLTELADQAMARGMSYVYEDTYEQLVRKMRIAERIPDDWIPGTIIMTAAEVSTDNNDGSGLLDDLL
ncbi:hypothetical protein H4R20_000683 [Coemansia guatemalensis]|uniref:GYF domain-containing protein n=1 Tax=Coemansia guatemalensis TaxID=2761395 RepID=A0A9W8LWQ3_9FUNG|nr:hypothetical protein H4R20_000683 [Coemansia guatemalensis]